MEGIFIACLCIYPHQIVNLLKGTKHAQLSLYWIFSLLDQSDNRKECRQIYYFIMGKILPLKMEKTIVFHLYQWQSGQSITERVLATLFNCRTKFSFPISLLSSLKFDYFFFHYWFRNLGGKGRILFSFPQTTILFNILSPVPELRKCSTNTW